MFVCEELCQCRSSLVYGLGASIAAACMCTYAQTSPLSAVLGPCCVWIMLQWRQKLRGPNLCGDGLRREPVPLVARRSQAWACVHGGACSVSACGGHCFDRSARSPSLLAWLGVRPWLPCRLGLLWPSRMESRTRWQERKSFHMARTAARRRRWQSRP